MARAITSQQRGDAPPLRDVLKLTTAHLRLTAFKYGFRRVGGPLMAADGSGPYVIWSGPWGVYVASDVGVLAQPLRQKVIADQIAHFSGLCWVCGANAERGEDGHIVIEHEEACSVSAESIFESAEDSAN